MPCPHCGETINICPYCEYNMYEEEQIEEFEECPKCGAEIDKCARCGGSLEGEIKSVAGRVAIIILTALIMFFGVIIRMLFESMK